MSLSPGHLLGVFEISGAIGAGGMGEVYRARDTKLNRDVAIKILPKAFADNPDRLARFEREAQTLAALNHPNIAHLHGVEDSGDTRALVIELVEGEDLSHRIASGPLPVPEALAIARQVADALAAAHEQGIIHRDLKPANIKVREDGTVKVLDFGLAKALVREGTSSSADAMNSPTQTMRETQLGVVLGTAAYMAPEQARGKAVDRRADTWAFGVVLYEMLTGRRAFDGADVSEVLASVLKDTLPLERVPAETPPSIRRLLRRCLEKDRTRRLDSMAAARLEIDEALGLGGESGVRDTLEVAAPPVGSALRRLAPWLALAAAVALVAWVLVIRPRPTVTAPAFRVSVLVGLDGALDPGMDPAIAISPDGAVLALAAKGTKEPQSRLYLRRLDQLTATPLSGTEGARTPFFSPDGRWIGFFAKGKLQKISINGGATVAIADSQNARGATWGEDDVITYAPGAIPGGRLYRIPAAGGTPAPLGPMPAGHVTQRWPQALPGNRAILYTGFTNVDNFDDACLVVQTLDNAPPRVVQCGGYAWQYVPSGHVLYVHSGTLFAAPFDASTFEVGVAGVPAIDGMFTTPTSGAVQFAVAPNGLAAYIAAAAGPATFPIEIVERAGRVSRLAAAPTSWDSLSFSPDGRKLALGIGAHNQTDAWVYDIERDTMTRVASAPAIELYPIWTPDGTRVTYGSAKNGPPNLFWKAADGSGDEVRLARSDLLQIPGAWTPDGKNLVFSQQEKSGGYDLWVLPMEGDQRTGLTPGKPRTFLATPATEELASVSPDGKWVSYASDESGQFQVYVRPLDGSAGKWRISNDSARWSAWSRTASELLFGGEDGRLMYVTYQATGGTFRASRPEVWTPVTYVPRSVFPAFTLSPDGARIATSVQSSQSTSPADRFVLISNFLDEVKAKVRNP